LPLSVDAITHERRSRAESKLRQASNTRHNARGVPICFLVKFGSQADMARSTRNALPLKADIDARNWNVR